MAESSDLKRYIRDIPDFPKKGIIFKDITPLLQEPAAFGRVIDRLEAHHRGDRIKTVAAIESRGFIFGGPLALRLGASFVPIRKPGKLPHEKLSETYSLEYGTDTIEMHRDAVSTGDRVLIVDDLLATGGTAAAAANLVRKLGGEVAGVSFVVELGFLGGRAKLGQTPIFSLINYE